MHTVWCLATYACPPALKRVSAYLLHRMKPVGESRSSAAVWPEPEEQCPSPLAVGGDARLADQPAPEIPTNYAWSHVDGYEGLLLHRLSPKLAERVYPWIATVRVEAFLGLLLAFGGTFASLPVVSPRFPEGWAMVSFILYLPALQRLALLDVRVLRLLIREFDTLYLLCSLLLVLVITVPMYKPFVHWYGFNMGVTTFNAFRPRRGELTTSGDASFATVHRHHHPTPTAFPPECHYTDSHSLLA
jgi:hypothetical protein